MTDIKVEARESLTTPNELHIFTLRNSVFKGMKDVPNQIKSLLWEIYNYKCDDHNEVKTETHLVAPQYNIHINLIEILDKSANRRKYQEKNRKIRKTL